MQNMDQRPNQALPRRAPGAWWNGAPPWEKCGAGCRSLGKS